MKKRILIVEDEDIIRKDIIRTLELSDYEALSASDGRQALKIALQYLPDLIISDIMMPEVDGFEFLLQLQQVKETADIPFLFLSAKSDKSDIREGMNLGADDFITKPFDIDELLNAVETRLKKRDISREKYDQKFESLRTSIRQNLPHEIRTPLSVIMGYTDLLMTNIERMKPGEVKDMLGNIKSSVKRLNTLVENYLLYANLEIIASNSSEVEKLRKARTVAPEVIINSVIRYESEKTGRQADVEANIDEAMIAVSELYFMKIIEEMVSNAFKFSSPGSKIEIDATKDEEFYYVSIKDHGRGMTPEEIAGIGAYIQFERKIYEQQGSGLGLIIARRLTELHGGTLKISSEYGEYTLIEMKFPLLEF